MDCAFLSMSFVFIGFFFSLPWLIFPQSRNQIPWTSNGKRLGITEPRRLLPKSPFFGYLKEKHSLLSHKTVFSSFPWLRLSLSFLPSSTSGFQAHVYLCDSSCFSGSLKSWCWQLCWSDEVCNYSSPQPATDYMCDHRMCWGELMCRQRQK